MIKYIRDLLNNRTDGMTIYKRYLENPKHQGDCRYTFLELVNISKCINQKLGELGESGFANWYDRFTIFEKNTLDRIQSVTEDRYPPIQRLVQTATERCTRTIRDIESVYRKERKLEDDWLALQKERAVYHGMDMNKALSGHKFMSTEEGDIRTG